MKATNKSTTGIDLQFDRSHVWHPYTSLQHPLKVYPVQSASGTQIILESGESLIDGMSSWWAAIHGYNHPDINKAAKAQIDTMSHVMFGGLTHAPAVNLCKKLVEISPEGLHKVFLSDSGSVSVEVAMKMAIQYHHSKGNKRKNKFLTLSKGYHGDTNAAMSVCDPVSGMHHLFQDFMPKHAFMQAPKMGFDYQLTAEDQQGIADFFEKNAAEAVAFILEPIVQGAGGMRIYAAGYLQLIHHYCNVYDILLIADEIATGFGRTGTLFACEHAAISPDIMCIGKGLTGGYLSLAATLCTDVVAETICTGEAGVMMHGPTFMGNPLACSIALASIELLLSSNWKQKIDHIQAQLLRYLAPAKKIAMVKDLRIIGAIAVLETHHAVDVEKAQTFFVNKGVWLRPFRNLLYIMPPYIIEDAALLQLCEAMIAAVQQPSIFKNH